MNYNKLTLVGLSAIWLSACSNTNPPEMTGEYIRVNNIAQERINEQQQQISVLYYQMQQLLKNQTPTPINVAPTLHQLYFPFNSARLPMTPQLRYDILQQALKAKRINLLGRTDGNRPTPADQKIAMDRAVNLRNYLVNNGVPASVIYINYASATDFVDNNWSNDGRANNRRVEIEIYPQLMQETTL